MDSLSRNKKELEDEKYLDDEDDAFLECVEAFLDDDNPAYHNDTIPDDAELEEERMGNSPACDDLFRTENDNLFQDGQQFSEFLDENHDAQMITYDIENNQQGSLLQLDKIGSQFYKKKNGVQQSSQAEKNNGNTKDQSSACNVPNGNIVGPRSIAKPNKHPAGGPRETEKATNALTQRNKNGERRLNSQEILQKFQSSSQSSDTMGNTTAEEDLRETNLVGSKQPHGSFKANNQQMGSAQLCASQQTNGLNKIIFNHDAPPSTVAHPKVREKIAHVNSPAQKPPSQISKGITKSTVCNHNGQTHNAQSLVKSAAKHPLNEKSINTLGKSSTVSSNEKCSPVLKCVRNNGLTEIDRRVHNSGRSDVENRSLEYNQNRLLKLKRKNFYNVHEPASSTSGTLPKSVCRNTNGDKLSAIPRNGEQEWPPEKLNAMHAEANLSSNLGITRHSSEESVIMSPHSSQSTGENMTLQLSEESDAEPFIPIITSSPTTSESNSKEQLECSPQTSRKDEGACRCMTGKEYNVEAFEKKVFEMLTASQQEMKELKETIASLTNKQKRSKEVVVVPYRVKKQVRRAYPVAIAEEIQDWQIGLGQNFDSPNNKKMIDFLTSYIRGADPSNFDAIIVNAAIKRYYTSLKQRESRERNNTADEHRKQQMKYDRKKSKLERRKKALIEINWTTERKKMVNDCLEIALMSSEDEDDNGEFVSTRYKEHSVKWRKHIAALDNMFMTEVASKKCLKYLTTRNPNGPWKEKTFKVTDSQLWMIKKKQAV